jgi:hypothetical protein
LLYNLFSAIEYAGIQLNLSGNKSPLRFKLAQ